jgi:hypothetical protein
MGISVFPAVSAAASSPTAYTVSIPASNAYIAFNAVQSLSTGIYSITTVPTTSNATITFYDSTNAIIGTTTTTSGVIVFNLATPAAGFFVKVDSATATTVTLDLTANALAGTGISGTIDTVTTTGAYNQTGKLYVLAVGGGSGGNGGGNINAGNAGGGAGGGGGGLASAFVFTNSATTITIGAAGNGGTAPNGSGNAGGTTSFGNLVTSNAPSGGGAGATGTTPAGGVAGSTLTNPAKDLSNGTNGGGGGGGSPFPNLGGPTGGGAGGGSGIGTGGAGGNGQNANATPNPGAAGTGYGAGGGGGAGGGQNGAVGGAGTAGVVYVLRGF